MKNIYLLVLLAIIVSCKKTKENPQPIDTKELTIDLSSSSIIMGDSVSFSLASNLVKENIQYNWILSGATPASSPLAKPKVKYKTNGVYDVKLIIKHNGKTDTLFKPKLIKVESTITEGLIAYYPFNGNAKDMTGNGHDGTPQSAVLTTDRFGNANAAYLFNGQTSSILVKDKADLRLNQTDFTINAWVQLDRYDASHGSSLLIKRGSGSQNGWGTSVTGYASQYTSVKKVGSAFFNVSGGGDPFAVGNNLIAIDKWCMITVVYNLTAKTVSLYIDGVLDNVTHNITSPNGNTNADLFIGSDNNIGTSGYHIKGKIDDIGFYNRMLSTAEINRIYFNSNSSTPPTFYY